MSVPVPPEASFSEYDVYRGDGKVTPLVTQLPWTDGADTQLADYLASSGVFTQLILKCYRAGTFLLKNEQTEDLLPNGNFFAKSS